jgi:hypothetical protein
MAESAPRITVGGFLRHGLNVTKWPGQRKADFSDAETQGFRIANTGTLFDGLPDERSLTGWPTRQCLSADASVHLPSVSER